MPLLQSLRMPMGVRFRPDAVNATRGAGAAWPTAGELMAARQASGPVEWLKTVLRRRLTRPHWQRLLDVLDVQPIWARRLSQDPRYFHCAQSHFVDRRFGMAQRIDALSADLTAASAIFGAPLSARIAAGEQVRLATIAPSLHLCLGLNSCSYHEGVWAMSIRDDDGRRLYYISLSFRSPQSVFIPTVQGPAGLSECPRALIRQITKQAEGMRPPTLLLAALRAACQSWGVIHLTGVAPEHHVKGRWNLRGKRLRFDYQGLWREQGAQRAADRHWSLPITAKPREAQDVPSNKRAMYRRRQLLVEHMAAQVQQSVMQANG